MFWGIQMKKNKVLENIFANGFNKSLFNKAGKGMHTYDMIKEGDKIALGISGGKDSLTLLNILVRVKHIAQIDFDIYPVHVSKGKDKPENIEKLKNFCKNLGLELDIIDTRINEIVFDEKKASNPCFLCGRMRRGVLYKYMKEKGYNKLALGHHLDDIIETYLMNLFYQGNKNMMRPIYHSEEYDVEVIRPLCFVEEETIIKYSKKKQLPIIPCNCKIFSVKLDPKRLETKILIKNLAKNNPQLRSNLKRALLTGEL